MKRGRSPATRRGGVTLASGLNVSRGGDVDLGDGPWLLWLALALAAGTAEVLSTNLIFLMVAGGGLAAAVVAAFGLGIPLQIVVFAVITALLLVAARPPLLAYVQRSLPATAMNAAALVGQD